MILDETRALRVFTDTRERLHKALLNATVRPDIDLEALREAIDILDDAIAKEVRALRTAHATH